MKFNLEDIKQHLLKSKYGYTVDSWFFAQDLAPHSSAFRYACKKLWEQGVLERDGSPTDHYGYHYHIKKERQ